MADARGCFSELGKISKSIEFDTMALRNARCRYELLKCCVTITLLTIGLGKSHLAAKVVRTLQSAGSNVLSIFLSYEKDQNITWISIMHSMMYQILRNDKQLRATFVAACNERNRDLLSSQEENEGLLLRLLSCIGQTYIVLDGVDEVSLSVRRDVLTRLIQFVGSSDGLRLLCSSREELDISNIIKAKSLTLHIGLKNAKDIQSFFEVHLADLLAGLDDLQDLEKYQIEHSLAVVPEKAKGVLPVSTNTWLTILGMFLYAKLVMEHLKMQESVFSIKSELQSLPQGLDKA